MDYQQSHRFMRPPPHPPPPPSMADPHHQPSLRQPVPPPGPWYPGQFQYQPPPQHSPSPPPPHQQWAHPPPPHSDHLPPHPYTAPPHPSYSAHNQYPPPPPPHPYPTHVPPQYHSHAQIPQSYPQDWGNSNWAHHQGWEFPAHPNEEDWAAKARAWAAAKTASDNQQSQSQFTPVSRLEEQSQYPQTVDPHYPDGLQPSVSASCYQQYAAPVAPPHRPAVAHQQESTYLSCGQSSFVPDEHFTHSARDGILTGDSNAVFPQRESSPTTSSVHLQEVPSSYSSVAGKDETGDQNEKFYKSFPVPIDSSQGLHHMHQPLPVVGRTFSIEQSHYGAGNQAAEAPIDRSDLPLDFAPRFNHDHDPLMQSNYTRTELRGPIRGADPVATVSSNHTWTPPAVPGTVYPPIPPALPSGQQRDFSTAIPSPVPGNSAALFGRMPGPSFQQTIPSIAAPFGVGTGNGLNPTAVFSGDVYGVNSVSDRPKKASVPNWLREEIIKKKAVIASSASDHPKEETELIEDEAVDRSLGKADQADRKSIDSARSTEEEDDDEDYVEATRTAAINQEIKRILTEVLLKVTDELFDEIATKVLSEDDLTADVEQNVITPNHALPPSAPSISASKASAKVLVPSKAKGTETQDDSGKSTSGAPGDVLGLASYASDDDDDDDDNTVHQRPSLGKLSEDNHTVDNGSSLIGTGGHSRSLRNVEGNTSAMVFNGANIRNGDVVTVLSDHKTAKGSSGGTAGSRYSSKTVSGVAEDEDNIPDAEAMDSADDPRPIHDIGENNMKTEPPQNTSTKKSVKDDSKDRETRSKQDKKDKHETRRSPAGKEVKEVGDGEDEKHEKLKRQDEKPVRKERSDDRNGSKEKEKMKEQGGKSGDKTKESDSRKKSLHPDAKEDRKEKERDRRANAKEDGYRRERIKDEKPERSRHKLASESSRHKRRRSSSVGSRGRSSKDIHANDSSAESSDDSRKLHSKRRNLSPSPNRSKKRQDSRSPHSKRSQRRHSPYSSLETTRGRRSRSRSPIRRQR